VHPNDGNAAAVIEFATAFLKVKKIVVCGHTKCGGAVASLGDADLGETLNTWLQPVRELRRKNKAELEKLADDDERSVRVAELNVLRSVDSVKEKPVVKKAISERGLTVHGLIYDVPTGQLRVLDVDSS
jgi:carbonic anhydrase